MANKTPLASWLYSKREELSPQFKELNWPERFLPGLFDFSTTIVWNGIESEGRGVDSIREIALEKSVAESVERLICTELGFDSVGFAIAGSHDPAPHARFEALERYFLNLHIQANMPFIKIETEPALAKKFHIINPNSKIAFYRMATPSKFFGVVCFITSKKSHTKSLGFALSESLDNSIHRSMLEALTNFAWLTEETMTTEDIGTRIPWHVATDFLKKIEPLLGQNENKDAHKSIFELPNLMQVDVLSSKLLILKNAPIHTARFILKKTEALK